VNVIQLALLFAVQVQPAGAAMAKLPVAAAGVYAAPAGDSEYVQAPAAV